MGLRTRLLVSSSAGLTLGVCVLTVENPARSAILCLILFKIADEHWQMLTYNEVSSGVRTTLPALCPLQAWVVIPLTRISSVRPSNIDSGSSLCPLRTQHMPPVYPPWPPGV